MQKTQGLRRWGKKSIHSKKTSIFVCRAVKARLDRQGFAMKMVHLRKIKLFGLKRRIVLLRNYADAAVFMAGLQMRDGARMTRHRVWSGACGPSSKGSAQKPNKNIDPQGSCHTWARKEDEDF